jgi:hypothetical protein
MGNENITWYHGGLGTHWTISVVAGVSGAPPSLPRGAGLLKGLLLTLLTPAVGAGYQQFEIRNLDTGSVETFELVDVNVGPGIGLGGSAGSGTSAYFETEQLTAMRDFEGVVRVTNIQAGNRSLHARLALPVDIKYDTLWETVWSGDSVDVSATANSVGLGLSWGFGNMLLTDIPATTTACTARRRPV